MKILLVDDDSLFREILKHRIESISSVDIIECYCGNDAIEYLKTNSVDLAISDYSMPNGNGFDIYHYIKENCPGLPFILITSYQLYEIEEFKNFIQERDVNLYIRKDVLHNSITTRLFRIIEHLI